jgi:hypothetical protein
MESSQIKGLFIIVVAAIFAVYLGIAAATAQTEAIAWVAGFMGVAFILALGNNVWMLIPVTLGLVGSVNAMPGSPPPWAIAIAITTLIYAMRIAMRRIRMTFHFDLMDLAILLQVAVVAQAWIRNPSGVMLFGGDSAGGKSNFLFLTAFVGYFCLAWTTTSMKHFKWALTATIVVLIGDGFISVIGDWIPSFASAIMPIYSNANFNVAMSGTADWDLESERAGGGFAILGRYLVIPLFSMVRPLSCLNPLRLHYFLIASGGCIMTLLSGFRSGAAYLAVVFIASSLIRRRVFDVMAVGMMSLLFLCLLMLSGQIRNLPFGVQRVLSILPVEVSAAARMDAENSSEWRFEMWRLAFFTDRYIRNKTLGDGFGISAREMQAKLDQTFSGTYQGFSIQDQMLATGSYHGFHVETIRFTGIVGLLAALIAMGIFFRKALQLVRYYRGRSEFPWVAYLCIPFLIYPFWSMLVFGAYRVEFPQFLVMAGMLKMLDNLRRAELLNPATEESVALPAPAGGNRLPAPAFASSAPRRA